MIFSHVAINSSKKHCSFQKQEKMDRERKTAGKGTCEPKDIGIGMPDEPDCCDANYESHGNGDDMGCRPELGIVPEH